MARYNKFHNNYLRCVCGVWLYEWNGLYVCVSLFVCAFICLCVNLCVRSFVCAFICVCVYLFVRACEREYSYT